MKELTIRTDSNMVEVVADHLGQKGHELIEKLEADTNASLSNLEELLQKMKKEHPHLLITFNEKIIE